MKKIIILSLLLILAPGVSSGKSDADGIEISGFVSQGYLKSSNNGFFADTEKGTFEFNELGINFMTDVTDRLRLGIQLFARDLGQLGNDEITLDFAYGDFQWRDWLGIRAGEMKLVHGFYNEIKDMDMLRTNIFYGQGVYNESWRDILALVKGAGLHGPLPMKSWGKLKYEIQIGGANIGADSGAAALLEDQVPANAPGLSADISKVDVDHVYSGSLVWYLPVEGLRLGVTAFDTYFEATTTLNLIPGEHILSVDAQNYVYSVEYCWENLTLASEWMITTYNLELAGRTVPQYDSVGNYASIAYIFSQWLEMAAYYSEYYADDDNKKGEGRFLQGQEHRAWLKDSCLSLRFNLNEHWLLKVEGHWFNGTGLLLNQDQSDPVIINNTPTYPYEKDWSLIAVKATFAF